MGATPRQRQAYLLVLIRDEAEPGVLRGRVRHVASESETAFAGVDELVAFLQAHSRPSRAPAQDAGAADAAAPSPPRP
jgi:hypothetical protein